MKKNIDELLSVHQVHKLKLIPWAIARQTLLKIIRRGELQHVQFGSGKAPRYFTTRNWINAYIKSQTRKAK